MIDRVQIGETITAAKTNQLVDAANREVKPAADGRGAKRSDAQGAEIIGGGPDLSRRPGWIVYREPFDLSVGESEQKLAITVTRAHAPNSQGGLDDIQVTESPMTFPAEEEVEVYFCELSSGARKIMWSTDENLSAAKSKTVMWKIGANGVVLEDLRGSFLGSGQQIELDLSSLNWKKNDDDEDTTTAQLWHYDELLSDDIADKSELTANNGWMFPIRPPDGEPHLKYVELSTLSSVAGGCECDLEQVLTSGTKIARWTPDGQNWTDIYAPSDGGGGGGCSCDLSVTPPATLSARGEDLIKIADWTKDNWQTHVEIYAPDSQLDINNVMARYALTPFSLQLVENAVGQGLIRFNFFYYGREFKRINDYILEGPGAYYLHIWTNSYGYAGAEIVRQAGDIFIPPTSPLQNTDTDTYYLLWTIQNVPYTKTTGIPFDYRHMYHLPFYSN